MTDHDRPHDLVLLGATGFVGRLTAAHLARFAPPGARIALAGRSPERLAQLARDLDVDWPLLEADSANDAAMASLAASTSVLATTVGPYLRHGVVAVAACARAGTSYADLSGESAFVARSIRDNHEHAASSGARIVHSCGFDSIPSDLSVGIASAAVGAVPIVEATTQVRSFRGGISGGTIDSLRQQLIEARSDPTIRRTMTDPFALTPGPSVRLPRGKGSRGVRRDAASGTWQAPFIMGSYNQQIVQRSNFLADWRYGELLRYREVIDTGRGIRGRAAGSAIDALPVLLGAALTFPPTRAIVDRVLPSPGEGPDAATRERGRFALEVDAYPVTGSPVRVRFAAPYDPGYGGTAIMLGESALSLAFDELPDRFGVLTPMIAMGEALPSRLRRHRFTIETSPLT